MKTEAAHREIQFGERFIPYSLHRTDRRNLRVVVNPDLSVMVYAPYGADIGKIEDGVTLAARRSSTLAGNTGSRLRMGHWGQRD
jgi:hypothetical protein